uniref:receptor like protein 29 n=1 Tax=Erigeron canadensis TaxID=72917 RepID=UPI001CB9C4C8|nr:receptor like protein 29 [Erigeron canadensis]
MFIFLLFFLLLTCTFHHVSTTTKNHNQTHLQPPHTMDPLELQTLYTIMETLSSDQKWRLNYPNPCKATTTWVGIECKQGVQDSHFHVTRLDFGTLPNPTCKNNIVSFPSQIFQLPYLQSIFFFQCFTKSKTTLSFPKSPNNLVTPSSLQQISLRSNPNLVGTIPSQLFTHLPSLQILTLSQSKLSGEIPPEISKLGSLVHLDLSYNHLTGDIPSELSNLKNLVGLDLSYNSLKGSIPNTIGQLSMLQKLDLSSNLLTGSIPTTIEKLTSLVFIELSNNGFHGKLPLGLVNLKGLEYFIMENNPMSIQLPILFGQLPKLQELRLANSGYSGEIPASFSQLSNLTTLSLQNNKLTGNIPLGFGNLSHIYHLNLSKNLLSGEVPFDSSFLKRLGKNLDLSENTQLCVNPMQAYDSAKLGVDVCDKRSTRVGNNNNISSNSMVKPLKKSKGRVVGFSRPTLFFMFLIALGVYVRI